MMGIPEQSPYFLDWLRPGRSPSPYSAVSGFMRDYPPRAGLTPNQSMMRPPVHPMFGDPSRWVVPHYGPRRPLPAPPPRYRPPDPYTRRLLDLWRTPPEPQTQGAPQEQLPFHGFTPGGRYSRTTARNPGAVNRPRPNIGAEFSGQGYVPGAPLGSWGGKGGGGNAQAWQTLLSAMVPNSPGNAIASLLGNWAFGPVGGAAASKAYDLLNGRFPNKTSTPTPIVAMPPASTPNIGRGSPLLFGPTPTTRSRNMRSTGLPSGLY